MYKKDFFEAIDLLFGLNSIFKNSKYIKKHIKNGNFLAFVDTNDGILVSIIDTIFIERLFNMTYTFKYLIFHKILISFIRIISIIGIILSIGHEYFLISVLVYMLIKILSVMINATIIKFIENDLKTPDELMEDTKQELNKLDFNNINLIEYMKEEY